MILLVDKIEKSFGARVLFSGASFQINPGERFALVGPNGAGKTTMLKIIMGIDSPDAGQVQYAKDCQVGYLEQETNLEHKDTTILAEVMAAAKEIRRMGERANELQAQITELSEQGKDVDALLNEYGQVQDRFEHLGGYELESNARKILSGLGFKVTDFERPCSEFSGGWQMRIALAKLFLRHPDLLLLDEPTNHLDLESVQWLRGFIASYDGAVLIVSHDRAFMDACVDHVAALENRRVTTYTGNYSSYLKQREDNLEQMRAKRAAQERDIAHMQVFVDKFRYKPTKSNQVQSRIKQLDRLERIEVEEEDLATLNIKFPPAPRSGQIVAEIKEAGMSFGSKHVFSGANFTIERGDKIALVGRNGEGKTTLARMIVGQLTPTEGSIRVGANVNIGYYAQNQEDLMNGDFTVYDTLDRVAVGDVRTRLRDILGAFLFRGEDIDKKVKVLSGGERARLAMARLMLEPYNLLILDEPTNHMDMRSKDILKNAIMKYDGTVIVVSHDREFLDGMVSKVYEFRNGGVREYLGGIYYFLEKRKLESLQEVERKDAPAKEAAPKASSSGKLTYEQKKEQEKLLRKLRKAVETIEASLADLEKKIADYDRKFAEATQYNEADYKAYNELKAEYDHQMHEWEKASYELEITEGE